MGSHARQGSRKAAKSNSIPTLPSMRNIQSTKQYAKPTQKLRPKNKLLTIRLELTSSTNTKQPNSAPKGSKYSKESNPNQHKTCGTNKSTMKKTRTRQTCKSNTNPIELRMHMESTRDQAHCEHIKKLVQPMLDITCNAIS